VVYTPWSNLLKDSGMEVGAVDFKDQKLKKFKHEVMKEKAILKAILKTKREEYPDLEKLQEEKL
jgi:hypothetical protein